MTSCLFVIDAQESFRHRPYFSAQECAPYLAAQNRLIEGCVARGVPVVRILHSDGPAQVDNPFAIESGLVRPLEGLAPFAPAISVIKHRHSALVGTGLEVWLTQQAISRIIISGIRTEQCCETTTRHASDLGWQIDYVTEATLTFDMRNADGSVLSAAQIRERSATVLHERFATVCDVGAALRRLDA